MTWTIEGARQRVGLDSADATRDGELVPAMAAALAIAESYCDREFEQVTDASQYVESVAGYTVGLRRYPIDAVTAVYADGEEVTDFVELKQSGRLNFDHRVECDTLEIVGTFGYATIPADAELALWSIFDRALGGQLEGGLGPGVKSANITGIGSITHETAPGDAGEFITGAGRAILRFYRRGSV